MDRPASGGFRCRRDRDADRPFRRARRAHPQGRNESVSMADFKPQHFNWRMEAGGVAVITLPRPERKNPITFGSYAELRDTFRQLVTASDVKAVVFGSNGGNFCSGGDVRDIIGPLLERDMKGLLEFTRMTGDLIKAIRGCPPPVIAALDGICV